MASKIQEQKKAGQTGQKPVFKAADYKTEVHNGWCPGCGDYGILSAVQMALAELQLPPHKVSVFSGIGCSSLTPNYMGTYGLYTLHGRSVPYAMGAKLANPELTVLAVGGDGDGYGIGCGHFISSGRRNIDMTYIVFNNAVYGLTKGQASPTLKRDKKPKSLPLPNINDAVNPLALALCAGHTFIARGYAFDIKHLKELIKKGIQHKGFAFIDVLQPCPTYNDLNTKEWFEGLVDEDGNPREKPLPRVYRLEETGYDPVVHDPTNEKEVREKMTQAFLKAQEWGDRIPIGIFYQAPGVASYEERLAERIPMLKKVSAAAQKIVDAGTGKPTTDITPLLDQLKVLG